VNCPILESKPGKDERSIYGSVRSWIDVRRLVRPCREIRQLRTDCSAASTQPAWSPTPATTSRRFSKRAERDGFIDTARWLSYQAQRDLHPTRISPSKP